MEKRMATPLNIWLSAGVVRVILMAAAEQVAMQQALLLFKQDKLELPLWALAEDRDQTLHSTA
jgi:hypothetical protein